MNIDLTEVWRVFKHTDFYNESVARSLRDTVSVFNPHYARVVDGDAFDDLMETVLYHNISDYDPVQSEQEAEALFSEILLFGIKEEGECIIKGSDYRLMMGCIAPISCALSIFAPEYFFPYFYQYKFDVLEYMFDLLGLELPSVPKRTDLKGRCWYYWEISKAVSAIKSRFNLTTQDLCVFLYEFIPGLMVKTNEDLPKPSQCWMIGGPLNPQDLESPSTLWQTNIDTRRGDILIHYETSPISAITGIWIAEKDAIVDPLSNWYSNTHIGQRIEIPHINRKTMIEDSVLSKFPLVKKNFQGVNGFPVDSATYSRLVELLESKGFDGIILPKPYTPSMPSGIIVESEHDVEERLLKPVLESFGLREGVDYIRQLGIHVGRGHRVFPDFAVHYNKEQETARVIIEAKLFMKSRADTEAAFVQAKSYALNLQAKAIVLCDKLRILVYLNRNGAFNMINPVQFGWGEMEIPEKYNDLKKLIVQH